MNGQRPSAARLATTVAQSLSIADALRRLGRADNATVRSHFRRWIAEDGVDTSHFLGQAHQRGKPSPTPMRAPEQILVRHDDNRRTRTVLLRRALRQIGVLEECALCGTGPLWNGKPMTLEIDHVNGDWSDDRAHNLRLLCPNCHATTATWCRGGRRSRT